MVDNDYISRAGAVQCARDVANDFKNDGFVAEAGGADTVGDWLQDFPAADVRPVVLCRDCKRYGGRPWENNESGICARTDVGVGEFDFCSYGEKREES